MNRISIKLRVTLWYTLIMTITSLIILAAMLSVSQSMIDRDISARLAKTVTDSARRFVMPGGQLRQMPQFMYYEQGVHMAVYDSDLNRLAGMIPFDWDNPPALSDGQLHSTVLDGKKYYIFDRKLRLPGNESIWLRGAVSFHDESYAMRSVFKTNLILTLALILAAAIGGYYLLHRALAPVDAISRTARKISESSDLSQRIAISGGRDEIHRLAATFDNMLDKIEKTLEREKQFTSDASHELRTPVAVMISECEYILDCAKTAEECKESTASIKRQAEKMSKLITELLALSRMDHGTQKINLEELDISELLQFVCEEQREIHDESICLIEEIPVGITATADRFLIARLFINLISNAYQYGREGGTVRVTLCQQTDTVTVTVADDGIGISPEQLPRIWERFYQVDAARSSREEGSMGLGLAMVQQIARCHNGQLRAESEPDKGTTFTFTMPQHQDTNE